jgi:hypothetical protein
MKAVPLTGVLTTQVSFCGARILAAWGRRMMIFLFGSSSKDKRPKPVIIIAASEAVPPGPACEGTNTEKPKAPSAPKRQARRRHAPACKPKQTPSHTPRLEALFAACRTIPKIFVLGHFFLKFCRSSNHCATGTFTVVGHVVAATRPSRVQTRYHNSTPHLSWLKHAFHRYFQGGRTLLARNHKTHSRK